jgi:hypothetical protein
VTGGSQPLLAIPDAVSKRLNVQLTRMVDHLSDNFEWNEKRWRLQFQSWVRKPQEVEGTLGRLGDIFPEDDHNYMQPTPPPREMNSLSGAKSAWLRTHIIFEAAEKQHKTGWHLKRVGDGIEGWFDLAKLPQTPSDKKPFASFDLERDGTIYRCQFHVLEITLALRETNRLGL